MKQVYFIRVDHKECTFNSMKSTIVESIIKFLHYSLDSITDIAFENNTIWLYATKDLEKVLGRIDKDIAFALPKDDYIQKIVVGLIGE